MMEEKNETMKLGQELTSHRRSMPPAVSKEQWIEAQKWELEFWNRQNIPPVWWKRLLRPLFLAVGLRPLRRKQKLDDRNHWWMEQFNGYSDLPRKIENACELGCGPYTNMRLISLNRDINYIHCSDPLARQYLTYHQAWLANAVHSGHVTVDFHPVEECPYRTDYFQLTVLINVLDHVRDAKKCLEEAIRIAAPLGYLVFGQDLTGPNNKHPSNPGHPFLLTHHQLEPIIDQACDRIYHRIVPREEISEPEMHYGALVYIGRKKKG